MLRCPVGWLVSWSQGMLAPLPTSLPQFHSCRRRMELLILMKKTKEGRKNICTPKERELRIKSEKIGHPHPLGPQLFAQRPTLGGRANVDQPSS